MNPTSPNWLVLKFGGTSVSSRSNWELIEQVVNRYSAEGHRICIVHSALSGISNKLQLLIEQAGSEEGEQLLIEIEQIHIQLAAELEVDGKTLLAKFFKELEQLIRGVALVGEASYRVQARIMALGELMATTLGAAFLKGRGIANSWLDARDLLQSVPQPNAGEKTRILSATCAYDTDKKLRQIFEGKKEVIITQGFIASDSEGKTVLLGRGGSDVSAAYLAARLGAHRLEIWTDVPGMFSANPGVVPSARLLRQLSYEEAQEIATNGAKVLHPGCIRPARRHGIPIHIKCTQKPDLSGTVITASAPDDEALVKAIAVRQNVVLVSMESLGMWQQVGFLAEAFDVFKQYGLSIDLVSTSESNVTVSLDPALNVHFQDIYSEFVDTLSGLCKVKIIQPTAALSLLGRHIRTILHRLGSAFEVFQEQQIYLVSQAANDLNFTFVVASDQAERLVRQLHEQIISQTGSPQAFGPSWAQLMESEDTARPAAEAWWVSKKDQLIKLAWQKGPVYVYDKEVLQQNADQLFSLNAIDQYFYAIKANTNTEVLTTFYEKGLGFECVSIGEVEHILALFPDIDRGRILFTPNFAPKSEYAQALEYGVHLTLDNSFPLQEWGEIFEGEEIFLRIDPGHGQGHHKHVKTGGIHSKFGIPRFEIPEVKRRLDELHITVKGLHAHIGSGIKNPDQWKSTALILHEVAKQLGGVEILDLGGGFGIPENEAQAALNMDEVQQFLQQFRQAHPGYTLWVEPGRYLVATAGVLLSRITQLKGKGSVRYVGVDTGMNSFIRPALYGSRHTIVNLSRLGESADQVVNVVGPICESGDKLGIDRLFPESEEGDVVLIANTGAYGRVMSSSYNLRPPAEEVVIS